MKPILYEANTVDFNNNGLGALTEAMFSQVTEERNGIFELSVVYPMSGKLYDRISEHMLLKVKPNRWTILTCLGYTVYKLTVSHRQ